MRQNANWMGLLAAVALGFFLGQGNAQRPAFAGGENAGAPLDMLLSDNGQVVVFRERGRLFKWWGSTLFQGIELIHDKNGLSAIKRFDLDIPDKGKDAALRRGDISKLSETHPAFWFERVSVQEFKQAKKRR